MAVKVGNSWVSETALTYARSKADSGASVTLKGLSERYPNINFSTSTQPFSQKGTNNIQIAPSILAQMQSNPEKRVEYEALIYDCAQLSSSGQINSNGHVKAAGTIINADGSVSGWSITQDDVGNEVKHKTKLDKTKKDTWADKLLEKQKEKRTQEKRADNLSISSAGQESYKQLSSVSYQGYVDRFENTLSELSASRNDDTSITNHFDYYANQMAASYDKMKSDIEAKYASDDYKPQYYIAESGRIEELTKDKELDMLKRAYESHSTLMASTTEIWESLKDISGSQEEFLTVMAKAYQVIYDRIEEDFADPDREPTWIKQEDGTLVEETKQDRIDALNKAYSSRAEFAASAAKSMADIEETFHGANYGLGFKDYSLDFGIGADWSANINALLYKNR